MNKRLLFPVFTLIFLASSLLLTSTPIYADDQPEVWNYEFTATTRDLKPEECVINNGMGKVCGELSADAVAKKKIQIKLPAVVLKNEDATPKDPEENSRLLTVKATSSYEHWTDLRKFKDEPITPSKMVKGYDQIPIIMYVIPGDKVAKTKFFGIYKLKVIVIKVKMTREGDGHTETRESTGEMNFYQLINIGTETK